MRKDYGTRTKMKDGGKLKMVTNKEGKKVPFYAADGKGKMAMGGRVKKMGGGSMMKVGGNVKKIEKAFGTKKKKNLKKVDAKKNPGLAKLPTKVRNKMGFMKKGGAVK